MKLSTAYQGYRTTKLGEGMSESTLVIYDWVFKEMIAQLGDPEVDKITKQDLNGFMFHMRHNYKTRAQKPLSSSSLDNAWKGIRSFFKWAFEDLGIERPDINLARPKVTSREIQPFTAEEVEKLLRACAQTKVYETNGRRRFRRKRESGLRDRAMVLLLLDTGLRVSEMCRLKIKDVDVKHGDVYVAPFGSGRKTKPRTVFLGKVARSALWRYLAERQDAQPDDPLFVTNEGRPMTRRSVHQLIQNLGERSGVKDAHPHRFRHTFATEFLRNGGTIEVLQKLLGHSTLTMSLRYAEIAQSDIESAHRKASPADRWRL